MIISHIKEYHKGWFVGDFSPALYRNKEFEIGHHKHTKGEPTFPHFHKLTTEMNISSKESSKFPAVFCKKATFGFTSLERLPMSHF